jgi:hypothetical protein
MKSQTRTLRLAERRLQGQVANGNFLEEANEHPNKPYVRHVLELLGILCEAERLRLKLYRSTPKDLVGHGTLRKTYEDFGAAVEKAKKLLSRYQWTPTVYSDNTFSSLSLAFRWHHTFSENKAVTWLLYKMRGSGMAPAPILRIRKCAWCAKWFYAITDHQKYCGTACRKKDHAQSQEFKDKRARYMRERRAAAKEGRPSWPVQVNRAEDH